MASVLDGVPVTENVVFRGQTKEDNFSAKAAPAPFAAGDVVRLKSGGPTMTVASCRNGIVEACWFDEAGALHKATAPANCVTRT